MNTSNFIKKVNISVKGGNLKTKGSLSVLRNDDLSTSNSFDKSNNFKIVVSEFEIKDDIIQLKLESQSMNLIKIKI